MKKELAAILVSNRILPKTLEDVSLLLQLYTGYILCFGAFSVRQRHLASTP